MSKVVAPRDTKPDSGKELTESNLLAEIWRKKSADCSFSKPTSAEYARIGNLGRQFRLRNFHEGHRLDFHSGKTVDQAIPSLETEDPPRSASTGESPLGKRG